jgi:predicted hydrolase (HD superfamily)
VLVEAGVRGYAGDEGLQPETVERWGIAGLLHDLDYERYPAPETHGAIGADELARRRYPEDVVHAVRSHNDALGIPRTSRLDHLVYACDEIAGFLVAVALMRPSKRLADVEPVHVRKRMKDRAFARAVPRDMLLRGAEEIGLDFDEHVERMVRYLGPVAPEVGL